MSGVIVVECPSFLSKKLLRNQDRWDGVVEICDYVGGWDASEPLDDSADYRQDHLKVKVPET